QYIEYQQKFLLPYTSELYDFQNQQMFAAGKDDLQTELALVTRIKRNANVMKNYRGKLKGLRNLDLVNDKRKEDEALVQFIESKTALKTKYGTLMSEIDRHYNAVFDIAPKELWFNNMYSSMSLLRAAHTINGFKEAILKQNGLKAQETLFNLNINQLREYLDNIYGSYRLVVDKNIGRHMFEEAYELRDANQLDFFAKKSFASKEEAGDYITSAMEKSRLNDKETLYNTVLKNIQSLKNYNDDLLVLQKELDDERETFHAEQNRREGVLNRLMGDYVAVKEKYQSKN